MQVCHPRLSEMVAAGGNMKKLGLRAGNPENRRGHAKLGRNLGMGTKVPPGIVPAPEG